MSFSKVGNARGIILRKIFFFLIIDYPQTCTEKVFLFVFRSFFIHIKFVSVLALLNVLYPTESLKRI